MPIRITIQQRQRCTDCGEIMQPGTETVQTRVEVGEKFKLEHKHADGCPVPLFEV